MRCRVRSCAVTAPWPAPAQQPWRYHGPPASPPPPAKGRPDKAGQPTTKAYIAGVTGCTVGFAFRGRDVTTHIFGYSGPEPDPAISPTITPS